MNNAIHATWKPNAHYESLIRIRAKDRKQFESLSPNTRIALGYYEASKRQAEIDAEAVRQAQATKR